jgi:hypothetical protein
LQTPGNNLTAAMWYMEDRDGDGYNGVFTKGHTAGGPQYQSWGIFENAKLEQYIGGVSLTDGNQYNTPASSAISLDTWYYFVLRFTRNVNVRLTIYNEDGTQFDDDQTSLIGTDYAIDYTTGALYFNDTIDDDQGNCFIHDFRLYADTLSNEEIYTIMRGGHVASRRYCHIPFERATLLDISGYDGSITDTTDGPTTSRGYPEKWTSVERVGSLWALEGAAAPVTRRIFVVT